MKKKYLRFMLTFLVSIFLFSNISAAGTLTTYDDNASAEIGTANSLSFGITKPTIIFRVYGDEDADAGG